MQWFKHDTDANCDARLKKLRMKYGLEGYGLYWYCLELIAANIGKDNLTFELEHDAEIIAFDTGIHYERVQEMMTFMVDLKLFEQNQGVVTCLKLAKRLDKSMTNSPKMREMIGEIRECHDVVSTRHERIDKNRIEENRKDKIKLGDGRKPNNLEEVINFFDDQLNIFNARPHAEKFYYHYEANGWTQGKGAKPLKKWGAAARTWKTNQRNWGHPLPEKPKQAEKAKPKTEQCKAVANDAIAKMKGLGI